MRLRVIEAVIDGVRGEELMMRGEYMKVVSCTLFDSENCFEFDMCEADRKRMERDVCVHIEDFGCTGIVVENFEDDAVRLVNLEAYLAIWQLWCYGQMYDDYTGLKQMAVDAFLSGCRYLEMMKRRKERDMVTETAYEVLNGFVTEIFVAMEDAVVTDARCRMALRNLNNIVKSDFKLVFMMKGTERDLKVLCEAKYVMDFADWERLEGRILELRSMMKCLVERKYVWRNRVLREMEGLVKWFGKEWTMRECWLQEMARRGDKRMKEMDFESIKENKLERARGMIEQLDERFVNREENERLWMLTKKLMETGRCPTVRKRVRMLHGRSYKYVVHTLYQIHNTVMGFAELNNEWVEFMFRIADHKLERDMFRRKVSEAPVRYEEMMRKRAEGYF